jgi:uncharacterized membrane-anchored protein
VLPAFDRVIAGTTFVPGSRYADFRPGDEVAPYGLATLVTGGAVVATKLGLFTKLAKLAVVFWKLIAVAVLGVVGVVRSLLRGKPAPAAAPTGVTVRPTP